MRLSLELKLASKPTNVYHLKTITTTNKNKNQLIPLSAYRPSLTDPRYASTPTNRLPCLRRQLLWRSFRAVLFEHHLVVWGQLGHLDHAARLEHLEHLERLVHLVHLDHSPAHLGLDWSPGVTKIKLKKYSSRILWANRVFESEIETKMACIGNFDRIGLEMRIATYVAWACVSPWKIIFNWIVM